jgi:hypothetical protein
MSLSSECNLQQEDRPSNDDCGLAYSKPPTGLYCILYPEGRIVANRNGMACCFESRDAALDFLKGRPELGEAFQVQEVYLKGSIYGWGKVTPESVEEKSLRELDA